MNNCKKYEKLLFLYREGELTADEETAVRRHTEECSRCSEILANLKAMDAELTRVRVNIPELHASGELVQSVARTIAGISTDVSALRAERNELLFLWLGRSLGFALLLLGILFLLQQSRDVMKQTALGNRLTADAASAAAISRASLIPDPADLLRSGAMDFFRQNRTLADELSRKYPDLAGVVPGDGIDLNERRILETEGKAFMNELEHLMQEGGQRP